MLKDLMIKFKDLPIFEERNIEDNNLELVVENTSLGKWVLVVDRIFGSPLKAAGQSVTPEHQEIVKDLGGVSDNQTLYRKDFADIFVVIMFWPWGNGSQTTINIYSFKK